MDALLGDLFLIKTDLRSMEKGKGYFSKTKKALRQKYVASGKI